MTQTVKKSIHTQTVPVEEVLETVTTALVPFSESVELIPGFTMPADMPLEERLKLNDIVESYTEADSINFDDFRTYDLEIEVLGVICKKIAPKIDPVTGQASHDVLTLVKFRHPEKGTGLLSFVSVKATEFARRMMLVFGRPGDFPVPVKYLIKQKPLDVGHTFTFKHVS